MGNTAPIFSKQGDIQGGITLTTAAADYTGTSAFTAIAFTADQTSGGYIQRLRFKANGTNVATVARVFFNNGVGRFAPVISAVSGTPTGTPSASGGTLLSGSYFMKVVAVDGYGALTAPSTETAAVSVTGPAGSITWSWTAVSGAASYMVFVGGASNQQGTWFQATTNSYVQTSMIGQRDSLNGIATNTLIGEVALPATTISATAPTVEIDYTLNMALPPKGRILVNLGTTVAAGWQVCGIGGSY